MMGHVPYDKWRELGPEDSIRLNTRWLNEGGIIKSTRIRSSPRADWRFLNEIKGELKV